MMVRHQPGGALAGLVECFWYSARHVAGHARERALPTGAMTLVIQLGGDPMRLFRNEADRAGQRFRESVVWSPQSGYVVMDTSRLGAAVGVQFRPGGAPAVLHVAAGELTDLHVSLEELWGAPARELRERLMEAHSPASLFAVLEQQLAARLRRPLLPHPAAAYALRELTARPSMARIDRVRAETGYGAKRFIELFVQSAGLTPKRFSRIRRFQPVLLQLARGQRVDLADVALDSGYCDQPHLNRDFRLFAGVTPGTYTPVSPDRPHHIAVAE